jgi:hypothetical protein
MEKSKDSLHIGDTIIYNGYIPDDVSYDDECFIKDRLIVGNQYKIDEIMTLYGHDIWYKIISCKIGIWAPSASFNIKYDMNKLYGLR